MLLTYFKGSVKTPLKKTYLLPLKCPCCLLPIDGACLFPPMECDGFGLDIDPPLWLGLLGLDIFPFGLDWLPCPRLSNPPLPLP